MKRLLLDVDGVIANCASPVHRFAQKLLRRPLPGPETWTSWDHDTAMGLTAEESRDFHREIKKSDVAFDIQFYENAEQTVEKLKQAFELVFVTAHWHYYPAWVPARDHLLEPFNVPVVYTHSKNLVFGDYLVDDRASTIEAGGPWRGLLFRRPWNSFSKYHDVVHSLEEVLELK